MPAWLFLVVGLLVVAGGLLALDWFAAGRSKRVIARARDENAGNAGIGYTLIERQGRSGQDQGSAL